MDILIVLLGFVREKQKLTANALVIYIPLNLDKRHNTYRMYFCFICMTHGNVHVFTV